MSTEFNADEIFEIAEQIERNGAMFYRNAAKVTVDDSAKKQLLDLAAMEDGHEATFKAMRKELLADETMKFLVGPDNEAALYLQSWAGGQIFNVHDDSRTKLGGQESREEILKRAIELERDSVAFYAGLKELVPTEKTKRSVHTILAEEMKHVALLSAQLAAERKQAGQSGPPDTKRVVT